MLELTETPEIAIHSNCRLNRKDVALIFLATLPAGFFTQTQVQSGLFLIAKNLAELFLIPYDFQPESYGPRASALYDDLRDLQEEAKIRIIQPNNSYREYIALPKGLQLAKQMMERLDDRSHAYIKEVVEWVSQLEMMTVIGAIFQNYPETAVNSMWAEKYK